MSVAIQMSIAEAKATTSRRVLAPLIPTRYQSGELASWDEYTLESSTATYGRLRYWPA